MAVRAAAAPAPPPSRASSLAAPAGPRALAPAASQMSAYSVDDSVLSTSATLVAEPLSSLRDPATDAHTDPFFPSPHHPTRPRSPMSSTLPPETELETQTETEACV